MLSKFKIERIYIAHELKYGLIFVIEAHPVVNAGFEVVVDSVLQLFFYPYNEEAYNNLLDYYENNNFVLLKYSEFDDDIVFDEQTNSDLEIYRHEAFRDMSFYNFFGGRDNILPAEIPNFQEKIESLTERFEKQKNEDYILDFVGNLAEFDKSFFAWLFEKQHLNRLTMFQQSPDKYLAVENLINQLQGMDEYQEDERTPIKIERCFYPPSYENWDGV